MLDYRRKFIEAAQRYNELSYKTIVAEAERMQALRNALICTILASAGKPCHSFSGNSDACFGNVQTVLMEIFRITVTTLHSCVLQNFCPVTFRSTEITNAGHTIQG